MCKEKLRKNEYLVMLLKLVINMTTYILIKKGLIGQILLLELLKKQLRLWWSCFEIWIKMYGSCRKEVWVGWGYGAHAVLALCFFAL